MKHMNRRLALSIFWVLLGLTLCICHIAGLMEDFWSGMGVALMVVGLLQVLRHVRYRTDRDYREKFDTEVRDERNKYLSSKAWAWAGYWFVLIAAIGTIVFKLMGREELMKLASASVCLIVLLYWLSYLALKRKY